MRFIPSTEGPQVRDRHGVTIAESQRIHDELQAPAFAGSGRAQRPREVEVLFSQEDAAKLLDLIEAQRVATGSHPVCVSQFASTALAVALHKATE